MAIKPDEKLMIQCNSGDGDQLAILYYKDACDFVFSFLGSGVVVQRETALEIVSWMQIALRREEVREVKEDTDCRVELFNCDMSSGD